MATDGNTQEEQTLRARTSKLDSNDHTSNVEDGGCKTIKRPKNLKSFLLKKSVKFFSLLFVAGLTASVLFEMITGYNRLYVYHLVGLLVASIATYYKIRLMINPDYKPYFDCGCDPDSIMGGIMVTLDHKKSALLFNVPNTIFGVGFYSLMIVLQFYGLNWVSLVFNLASCTGSLYLWYTMINEVKAVCIICTTIHAVNFLTLMALALLLV